MVVDDHPAIRLGVRAMMASAPDLRLVAEADGQESAMRLIAELPPGERPDVVLLDLHLGAGLFQGIDLIRALVALEPAPAVLVLSAYGGDQDVFAAIDAGATGFLGKETAADALLPGLRAAARGSRCSAPRRSTACCAGCAAAVPRCRVARWRCCTCSRTASPTGRSRRDCSSARRLPRAI